MTESTDSETVFQRIADELVAANDGVEHGRMMSAPAVTWGGKVFAFYSRRGGPLGMGFRLGRDYEFGTLPVKDCAFQDQAAHARLDQGGRQGFRPLAPDRRASPRADAGERMSS